MSDASIRMFGADWCRDCIRTKKQLDVVVYPDASHHVEPSNADVEAKLRELSLI